jgi:hypothetical protein
MVAHFLIETRCSPTTASREEPDYDLSVELRSFIPTAVHLEVHVSDCRCVDPELAPGRERLTGRAGDHGFFACTVQGAGSITLTSTCVTSKPGHFVWNTDRSLEL